MNIKKNWWYHDQKNESRHAKADLRLDPLINISFREFQYCIEREHYYFKSCPVFFRYDGNKSSVVIWILGFSFDVSYSWSTFQNDLNDWLVFLKALTHIDRGPPSKRSGLRGEEPSELKGWKTYKDYWHPPVCQNYKPETGCKYGRKCFFKHVQAEEKSIKKSKKGGAKGRAALLRESVQADYVSQDSHPRKSIPR